MVSGGAVVEEIRGIHELSPVPSGACLEVPATCLWEIFVPCSLGFPAACSLGSLQRVSGSP